jgi:mutator protein MutT
LNDSARQDRPRPVVHVVAGVLVDAAGRVLLAQRPMKAKHLAGGWEFPGGKIEQGETRIEGLGRELAEEIGVTLQQAHPLIRVRHAYPERDIDLDVWRVTRYAGEPHGLEGQPLSWCPRAELPKAQLIPADRPVVTALMLPEVIAAAEGPHYVIPVAAGAPTGGRGISQGLRGTFCRGASDAAAAVAGGADFLLVRDILDLPSIAALTTGLNVPVYVRHVALSDAWEQGATGVHTLDF